MTNLPLSLWIAGLLLALTCLAGAAVIFRRSRARASAEAGAMLAGGVALLGLAILVELLVRELTNNDTTLAGSVSGIAGLVLIAVAWQAHRRAGNPQAPGSRFSWLEKSNLLMGAALVAVYGWYFWNTAGGKLEQAVPLFIGAVVAMVVIAIIGHVLLALTHYPKNDLEHPRDERDHMIALLAGRNASRVLALGLWLTLSLLLLPVDMLTRLNVAFAALVVAEVVRCTSQAWYYRRGTP